MKHFQLIGGLLALSIAVGCTRTHDPVPPPIKPVTSETPIASLETMRVVAAQSPPEDEFTTPIRGRGTGAAKGAAGGALEGMGQGFVAGGPLGLILMLPIGIVVGSIAGAGEAVPESTAQEIEATIIEKIATPRLQQRFRDCVATSARKEVPHIRILPNEEAAVPADTTDLVEDGAEGLLTITVTTVGFTGSGGGDPNLALHLKLHARLESVADGRLLYEHTLGHLSPPRAFTEWGAEDAALVAAELEHTCWRLGERIVEEVFLLRLPKEEVGPA